MRDRRSFLIAILMFVTTSCLPGLAFAQSNNPAWLEDLEFQLATEKECKVVAYLSLHEGQLGGRNTYTARVKCADGRLFDAHRIEPQDEFSIKPCEIVAC